MGGSLSFPAEGQLYTAVGKRLCLCEGKSFIDCRNPEPAAVVYFTTGMPGAGVLPGMAVELGVYGLAGGLCMEHLHLEEKKRVYVSLIIAMLAGRAAGGLMHALILDAGSYSLKMWASSYLAATAPGMVFVFSDVI